MKLPLPVKQPFSFAQTLHFVRRFPACRNDYILTDDSLTAAVVVGGRPTVFTIHGDLTVETEAAYAPAVLARAAHLLGSRDDLEPFYRAAAGDPPMAALVRMLYGLHHVRFLTLEEIAVYSVMMQRRSPEQAARMKQRFMERFGIPVRVGDRTLYALPPMDALARLSGATIGEAIGHAAKGEVIASVLRGVSKIGEKFLCEAPYEAARAELLEISGVGPFSAAAILLRGLGRMDDLPEMVAEDEARALYGTYDRAAIRRRYGNQIGYWSFYLKTGVARSPERIVKSDHVESPAPRRRARR